MKARVDRVLGGNADRLEQNSFTIKSCHKLSCKLIENSADLLKLTK